ncbi:hypothetical protein [Campylobacter troglodytis]|uniref:hypothetical protein n=1 Tax=Campylobacter troglodytis TaxID=654363 RepID=UPI0011578081|nr:hypothetical protein [Campylobacter troglodytis]TQR54618.1 hypothetical protein DMC01_10050 [Campylobacter troglodytis]
MKKEKANRTRYLRALEKFYNIALLSLKKEDFNKDIFEKTVLKNYALFDKNSAVTLNSAYTRGLEDFVNDCLSLTFSKEDLVSKANALEKLKKEKSYKKEKHKAKLRRLDDNCDL